MNAVRIVWSFLPEDVKNRIRSLVANFKQSYARFSVQGRTFAITINDKVIRTKDHPFNLIDSFDQYALRHRISAGEIVMDAGAFHGHLTLLYALLVGQQGKVIAVEPDNDNLVELKENFDLNPKLENIELIAKALWDGNCEIDFFEQGNEASSSFYSPSGFKSQKKLATSIDNIVRGLRLPRLDFIKMDIEGAELRALEGAIYTLKEYKPDLAIASYHYVNGKQTFPSVENILSSLGYRFETVLFKKECITYGSPI